MIKTSPKSAGIEVLDKGRILLTVGDRSEVKIDDEKSSPGQPVVQTRT